MKNVSFSPIFGCLVAASALAGCATTPAPNPRVARSQTLAPTSLHDALVLLPKHSGTSIVPQINQTTLTAHPKNVGPTPVPRPPRITVASNARTITSLTVQNSLAPAPANQPGISHPATGATDPAATLMSVLRNNQTGKKPLLVPTRTLQSQAAKLNSAPAATDGAKQTTLEKTESVRTNIPAPRIKTMVLSTPAEMLDPRIGNALRNRANAPQNMLPAAGISDKDIANLF